MKWGLVPHWSKSASDAASTINARSETAATKPAFRDPLKFRRCDERQLKVLINDN